MGKKDRHTVLRLVLATLAGHPFAHFPVTETSVERQLQAVEGSEQVLVFHCSLAPQTALASRTRTTALSGHYYSLPARPTRLERNARSD